jgi:phenylacetate-CoA ligase
VKLLPLAVTTVLEDEADVYRFQLCQSGATALTLHLDSLSDYTGSRCREALEQFLYTHGLPNVQLAIQEHPLQRSPVSGKLQRIVAKRQ